MPAVQSQSAILVREAKDNKLTVSRARLKTEIAKHQITMSSAQLKVSFVLILSDDSLL